jgi:acetyl esterase/lipase
MRIFITLITLVFSSYAFSQHQEIPLWPDRVPFALPNDLQERIVEGNITRLHDVTVPSLTVYMPPEDKASGAAVIICPGGGYQILAIDHEGYDVAQWFNEQGIAAFVLKYRLPNDEAMEQKEIVPILDLQQAIRTVRRQAPEWGINQDQIGVMGFSAGGHLASTGATHYSDNIGGIDDETSLRPDFSVLIYPVITFQPDFYHQGSREALIGPDASHEMVERFSNHLRVTDDTPPTFLIHASDDLVVPVENSINYYLALRENGVPAEMHIYETGGHGFGMAEGQEHLSTWLDEFRLWLASRGLVSEG